MTILLRGAELEQFDSTYTSGVTYSTDTDVRPGYPRASLYAAINGAAACGVFSASSSDFWLSAQIKRVATDAQTFLEFTSSDFAYPLLYLKGSATGLVLQENTGLATATLATGTVLPPNECRLDVQVVGFGDATGAGVRVYADGALVLNYSGGLDGYNDGVNPAVTSVGGVMLGCISGTISGGLYVSELIVADEDTRELSLVTLAPNATGTLTSWTGAYTTIDEIAVSTADYVYADTTDTASSFGLGAMPSGGHRVKEVAVTAYGKKEATGPNTLSIGLVIDSVAYYHPSTHALTTSWATYASSWTLNPATGKAWTKDELDDVEVALKAVTV